MNNFEQFLRLGMEGIFYVTTLIFIGFSLSIIYHWFAYGIHKSKVLILLVDYLAVKHSHMAIAFLALNAL